MKKRSSAAQSRRLAVQFVLAVAVVAFTASLLRFAARTPAPELPTTAAVADDYQEPNAGEAKIAFLFLARSALPLDFLWDSFFKNAEEERFSIYVHSEPGFVFDFSTTSSAFFYNRQIRGSVKVVWGESSMIEAERLLLREAMEDPANRRFVLLSDSCVPLYNFSYIYDYLMSSPKSFVDSFLDTKEERYDAKMSPIIPKQNWRKGSQWIALIRRHAAVVVADNVVYPAFRRLCKRQLTAILGGRRATKEDTEKEHDCIPDEHYVQTLLSMKHFEDEIERRTLTYTLWNQSTNKNETNSWHPMTFEFRHAKRERMAEIRKIDHVHYETESRTEWCQCNAKPVPCFLFARKFSRGAAMRMIMDGQIGHIDPASVFLRPKHE